MIRLYSTCFTDRKALWSNREGNIPEYSYFFGAWIFANPGCVWGTSYPLLFWCAFQGDSRGFDRHMSLGQQWDTNGHQARWDQRLWPIAGDMYNPCHSISEANWGYNCHRLHRNIFVWGKIRYIGHSTWHSNSPCFMRQSSTHVQKWILFSLLDYLTTGLRRSEFLTTSWKSQGNV
jgi:hypothetical protein